MERRKIRLLLIDDEQIVREVLGSILEELGYEVLTASDGEEGLVLFRREQPDLLISDIRMPRRDGLQVAMAVRQEAPEVPVTVITANGTETLLLKALRAGVTDFVKKPVRMEDLRAALERMKAARRQARMQHPETFPDSVELLDLRWTYRLKNDLEAIPAFVDMLISRFGSLLRPQAAMELNLALRELLINAVEHGNLGITFEEKARALENGTLDALLARRSGEPGRKNRHVTVELHYAKSRITVQITDEGEGFDWRNQPDPLDPTTALDVHGRGLVLARLSVDHLQPNARGNQVTVIKNLKENPQ